jgi:hypothetical protein
MVKWCAYTVFERTRYRTPVAGYICYNTTISNHNKLYDTGNVTILTGNSEFLICLVQYLKTKQYNIVYILSFGCKTWFVILRYESECKWGGRNRRPLHRDHFLIYCAVPSFVFRQQSRAYNEAQYLGWLVGSLRTLLQYVDVGGRVTRYDYEYESIW